MKKETTSRSGFLNPRLLIATALSAAACFVVTGTLLAFLRPDVPAKVSNRALTFADRVAYQHAIEEVYWRHRIWPEERHPRRSARGRELLPVNQDAINGALLIEYLAVI